MRLAGIVALVMATSLPLSGAAEDVDPEFRQWLQPDVGPKEDWVAVARGVVDVDGGLMRLAARRDGLIIEVMAEAGDHVSKGQALARIDDSGPRMQLGLVQGDVAQSELQAELAQLRLENARSDLARLEPLARLDALPAKQIEEARRAVRLADVELRVARQNTENARRRIAVQQQEIENSIVRAPVDGVILRRSARPGDATSSSTVTEMFLLAPDGRRVVKGQLDEQFVGQVRAGQKAQIMPERNAAMQFDGTVLRVALVFGSATSGSSSQGSDAARTVEIIVTLDGPADQVSDLVLGQRMIARILK